MQGVRLLLPFRSAWLGFCPLGTQAIAMVHIDIRHIPFALSMLPFFAIGIAFPVTMQDWLHGRLTPGDALDFLVGLLVIGVLERVIVCCIRLKERRGQDRLLGRELSSWSWAPPITFIVGAVSGLVLLCT
jgi:hypothetical protein